MIIKRHRTLILFSLLILLVIALVPKCPLWMKIPLIIALCVVSLLAVIAIALFYLSLPDAKKSILSYLMVSLMCVVFVSIMWFLFATISMEIPLFMEMLITKSSTLTCTLLTYEYTFFPANLIITAIIIHKIILIRNSFIFHEMNHERRFKQTMFVILTISLTLILLKLLKVPCESGKKRRIELYSGMHLDIPHTGTYYSKATNMQH